MAQLRGVDEKYLDASGELGAGAFGGGGTMTGESQPMSPGGAQLANLTPGEMSRPGPQTDYGSKETPRERQPQLPGSVQPRTISPPSPEGQMGVQMTPPRPPVPDILAGKSFVAPTGHQLINGPGGNMFGKAGGLLGGGLGVPGKMADENPDISPLLALLSTLGG